MIELILYLLEEQKDVLLLKWRTDYQRGTIDENALYNYVVNKYKLQLRNQ